MDNFVFNVKILNCQLIYILANSKTVAEACTGFNHEMVLMFPSPFEETLEIV